MTKRRGLLLRRHAPHVILRYSEGSGSDSLSPGTPGERAGVTGALGSWTDETRMTNQIGMTNAQMTKRMQEIPLRFVVHSDFVIRHSKTPPSPPPSPPEYR